MFADRARYSIRVRLESLRRMAVRLVRARLIRSVDRSLHRTCDVGRLGGLDAVENNLMALDNLVEDEMADGSVAREPRASIVRPASARAPDRVGDDGRHHALM